MGKTFAESKIFNIILAILIAVGLWVYVTTIVNDESTKQISNIPVTVLGEDVLSNKGLMLDPGVKLSVNLRLTGGRTTLVSIINSPLDYYTASIDVSGLDEAGTYDLPVKISPKNALATSLVTIEGKNEQTIRVDVSKMKEKDIEVRSGMLSVTIPTGYRANQAEISPSTIRIRGPESVVNQIQYAQVNIPAGELTKTYSGDLPFEYVTSGGDVVDDADITASVDTVSVILPVVKTLELPLTVGYVYGGGVTKDNFQRYVTCDIEPKTIQISGAEDDVAGLEGRSITLGDIDLSTVGENSQIKLPILLNSALTNDSGVSEATVTINVKGLDTRVIETNNIEIINASEPFTPTAVTQSLKVTVRGPTEALEKISDYQLRVVVDLKDEALMPGQFFYRARIYLDDDGQCGVITTSDQGYGIVVNIQ